MTEEIRTKANQLARQLEDLKAQVQIVEDMYCDIDIHIACEGVGDVTITYDDELKDTILDVVLNKLTTQKEEVEDEYRRL